MGSSGFRLEVWLFRKNVGLQLAEFPAEQIIQWIFNSVKGGWQISQWNGKSASGKPVKIQWNLVSFFASQWNYHADNEKVDSVKQNGKSASEILIQSSKMAHQPLKWQSSQWKASENLMKFGGIISSTGRGRWLNFWIWHLNWQEGC